MAKEKPKKVSPDFQVLEMCIDTHLLSSTEIGADVQKMCESLSVKYVLQDQLFANTITWQLATGDPEMGDQQKEPLDEILNIIPTCDFLCMVASQAMNGEGKYSSYDTLTQYIQNIQQVFSNRHVSVALCGVEEYFRDHNNMKKRQFSKAGSRMKSKKKQIFSDVTVSRLQVEESLVVAQLETGHVCRLVDTVQELLDLVKCFIKAIQDKPNKKDRYDSAFSFLEEGRSGVRPGKAGVGLIKVWKLQLQQLYNMGPDMAAAIVSNFPSPRALWHAYKNYPIQHDAWKVTESIVVRRGAGALETERRVGPQISKRLHLFMTSGDAFSIVC